MKYMLLMQFSSANADFPFIGDWEPEEIQAHIAFMGEVNDQIVKAGEFVDAQGLAGVDTVKIVRADSAGAPVVSEGPFAETKEWVAGFWIVDTETEQRAVELAAHISTAPGPGGKPLNMPIEVRAVMSEPPAELCPAIGTDTRIDDLLRELAPQVVGVLARRSGDFGAAEDAVQEALLAASLQWPNDGLPDNPRGWLVQVASRRLVDQVRREQARRRREDLVSQQVPVALQSALPADVEDDSDRDDTLVVLLMCCHPALSTASAIALTLRSVGGLSTAEIAAAFLVPESTMAQRISRAKATLKSNGATFNLPERDDWPQRLDAVLQVLYLIFNEGHTSSAGGALQRPDLAGEAIRLARALRAQLPADPEVAGLLALMLLTDARSAARTAPDGAVVPLAEQDRSRWDTAAIAAGVALLTKALPRGRIGAYQLQAAISALHDEAPSAGETDWPQILALYGVLERVADSPVVTLNKAIALAMVHGPAAALVTLDQLGGDKRLRGHHRLHAARGHLLEMAGDLAGAAAEYRAAASRTTSAPERDFLTLRAARLAHSIGGASG